MQPNDQIEAKALLRDAQIGQIALRMWPNGSWTIEGSHVARIGAYKDLDEAMESFKDMIDDAIEQVDKVEDIAPSNIGHIKAR